MQGPADGPVIGGLGRLGERGRGDPPASRSGRVRGGPGDGHQQPGPVPGGDPRLGQGLVQRGQRLRESPLPAALGQGPVQVHEEIGSLVVASPGGHLLGPGRIADAVEGLGERQTQQPSCRAEPVGEFATAWRRSSAAARGACPTSKSAVRPSQLSIHSSIGSAIAPGRPCLQQLAGDPVRRCAGVSEGASRLAVPGGPHRQRYLLVQGRADQWMTEPEAGAGLGQDAGGPGLVHGRDQVRHAPV